MHISVIAALFTVAETGRQPTCPLIKDWIKKMWLIFTMEYYSATRKYDVLPFATMWVNLENIMLSEAQAL